MASSGKKGKKNKGTVISLQSFLSNGETTVGTTQVSKKIRNTDGDDSDDGTNSLPLVYQLPTAPRANRIFDDDSISHKPPFMSYITNLPFDANEDDIYDFFDSTPIVSLRLPREDGETGRVRGFGYVEFENREDLIHVLSLPDPSIKGRRIRIELSNENDQQNNRQKGNRRGFDNFGNSGENRDSTNWRRDNISQEVGYDRDRGYNRDRKFVSEENSGPGSWRTGSRSVAHDSSPRSDRSNGRYRDDAIRTRNPNRDDESFQERPKLNLKPRTLPLPEIVLKSESEAEVVEASVPLKSFKSAGVSSEKVFGSAKPVDTAAKEMQIEERLAEARRQENIRREQEQEEINLNDKFIEMDLEKNEKENANSAISWRNKNEPLINDKTDISQHSPDKEDLLEDDCRRDNRSKDFSHYNKNRDKNDRSEFQRDKYYKGELREKDDNRAKRDVKSERPLAKFQPNQSEPVLQSSNKYSGLNDEASD